MNRETLPDEHTQTESYRSIVEAMDGDPVTIRVLDWGGEKDIEALQREGLVPEVRRRTRRWACAASACCCAARSCSKPSSPPSCAPPMPARCACCCRW